MGKELVKKETKPNAIEALASRLQVTPDTLQKTLKATTFKNCKTNEEFVSAVIVANTYGLNPILKQMYVFPSQGGIIPIIPIDGWIELVNRETCYDGVELIENEDEDDEAPGGLKSVTAKFYLKNKSHPVVITEYMNECYNGNKEPWKKWPRRMLRHKAYIQGARIAFGFSGVYDEDEGERIIEAQVAEESHMKPAVEMPKALPTAEKETAPPKEETVDEPLVFFGDTEDRDRKLKPKEKSMIFIQIKKYDIPEEILREAMKVNFDKKSTGELTVGETIELYAWMKDYAKIIAEDKGNG